jgi:hypothetical protein
MHVWSLVRKHGVDFIILPCGLAPAEESEREG